MFAISLDHSIEVQKKHNNLESKYECFVKTSLLNIYSINKDLI